MSKTIDYLLLIDPATVNLACLLFEVKDKKICKWGVFDIKDSTYEGMAIKMANKLDNLDLLSDDSTKDNKIPIVEDKAMDTQVKKVKKTKKRTEDDIYVCDYSNKKGKNVAIVIEFQMSKNSKTVNIVGQLFMYFTMAKSRPNSMNLVKIVTYPAKEKLKYYTPMLGDLPMPEERLAKLNEGKKSKYYYNKQLGIEHCRRVLAQHKEPKETIDFFESCSKKDDLADTYLMGCRYAQMYIWTN